MKDSILTTFRRGEADVRTAEKAVRALSYDLLAGGVRRVAEIVGRLSLSWRRGLVLLDRRDRDQTGRYQRLQLLLRRLERTTVSTDDDGDNRKETFEPPKQVRKLLRELAGAQMWQIEEVRPRTGQRWPTIYYEVTGAGVVKTFGRPHEAWECFQKLTTAPVR